MNARTSIVKALVDKFKAIDGTNGFISNLSGNVFSEMKFWDEINDYPAVYVVPGIEHREYLPGNLKWGILKINIWFYVKEEDPSVPLENLLTDLEQVIDDSLSLNYNLSIDCAQLADLRILSIVTDEGLLAPYGVGQLTLEAKYQVL